MAITLYATRADVRAEYEGTIPDEAKFNERLDRLLTRASAKLSSLVGSLDQRMAEGAVDPEVPAGMVVEAVLRVWRNPAGVTQQGVGPFQQSFNANAAKNEIIFDKDEIDRLKEETSAPSSFRVMFPGRVGPVDGFVDASRPVNIALHYPGL